MWREGISSPESRKVPLMSGHKKADQSIRKFENSKVLKFRLGHVLKLTAAHSGLWGSFYIFVCKTHWPPRDP